MTHVFLATDALAPPVLDLFGQDLGLLISVVSPTGPPVEPGWARPDLLLAPLGGKAVEPVTDIARRLGIAWIGWNLEDDPATTVTAYEAGALAVLPAGISLAAMAETLHAAAGRNGRVMDETGLRHFRRGDLIQIPDDHVLTVQSGVIALITTYEDGAEVLAGLCGPGTPIIRAAADGPVPRAYADGTGTIRLWRQCLADPGFSAGLGRRLRDADAWASIQGHPHLERRVMGVLELLGERFGTARPDGTLLDVDFTHAQLATAVGTTRSTLTRQIAVLRKRGRVRTVNTGSGRRFLLPGRGKSGT